MTIRRKLSAGIGILLTLFVALGVISYFQIGQIDENLTEIIHGKELGKRTALLYERYKILDDAAKGTKDRQDTLVAAGAENFERIDAIIHSKTDLLIAPNEPDGYQKVLALFKIKTGITEVAVSLGTFLWSPKEVFEKRLFDNIALVNGELERLHDLPLTEEEAGIATTIETAFHDTILQIRQIVMISNHLREQTAELMNVRAQIDKVLDQDFEVFTSTDLERAKEAGHKMVGTTVAITLILVFTGFLDVSVFSAAISRSITRPLAKLKDAVAEIGKGDFDTKIEIESNDEIGQLATTFKQMAKQRKQAEDELRKARDELEVRVEERTADLIQANKILESEIAERQKAEHALDKLNRYLESSVRELTRSNKELQEFSYIAAHDLKTPLRGIATLADWISTDNADMLDEEGKEHINLLLGRTRQMNFLIDGILRYSSLGQNEHGRQPVDLNKVLPEVVAAMELPQNIEIIIANNLPTLLCEKQHIMEVFVNLVNNAVTYMDKPHGQITIACVEEDVFWKLSVTDNGPGIGRQYFERIFRIFQTLAPRDETGSTGIGLAIVKKIVELNAGNVWVESEPGKGSTFYFTLPKQITVVCPDQENTKA